jgi:hypothetical protein
MLLVMVTLLAGCATNQLHFAPYTTEQELAALEKQRIGVDVMEVAGIETCNECTESSKIVWHAANYNGSLYEGFTALPINWEQFVNASLNSDPAARPKVKVVIERIFLKTWNDPAYFACLSDITVYTGAFKYPGKAVIKIQAPGQRLLAPNLAVLDPAVLRAVRLSLKSAYLNAISTH